MNEKHSIIDSDFQDHLKTKTLNSDMCLSSTPGPKGRRDNLCIGLLSLSSEMYFYTEKFCFHKNQAYISCLQFSTFSSWVFLEHFLPL